MNKLKSTFLILFVFFICFSSNANNKDLFQVDDIQIASEFQAIDALEQFVNQNDGVTLTQMIEDNNTTLLVNSNFDIEQTRTFSLSKPYGEDDTILWVVIIAVLVIGFGSCLSYWLFG